jgi:cytochrome c oxidase assembly protein subunit 19
MVHRNLMAKDEFKNLGFGNDKPALEPKKDGEEKGKKGELRW